MTVLLVAEQIACSYGEKTVLQDFQLVAEPGTVTAVLGPNGAGKSTALRTMARLLRPQRGRVTLDGRDVWQLSQREFVRHVAFVPQADATAWPMTVEQVVLLGRMPHRGWLFPYSSEDREALDHALHQVELEELRDRNLDTLSGGERRRAMVARALAQNAQVLLLDEPGAHVDLKHQVDMFSLLRRLARERALAVVISIHDLNMASLFADRALLLNGGCTLAQGLPQAVLTPALIREAFGLTVETLSHPRCELSMILPVVHPESTSANREPTLTDKH